MYKVGVCGHFGVGKEFVDGQTIKTKILTEELIKKLGNDKVLTLDTYNWKKKPFALLINCLKLLIKSENIIVLPAHNGVKVFIPLFCILNLFLKRKIHYVVIGGWLPKLAHKYKWLTYFLKKVNGIYVETKCMGLVLEKEGFTNIVYMPNFKRLNVLNKEELIYQRSMPYRLCTFSRVVKEKGIEDIIQVVESINKKQGRLICTLDIYGPIDVNYEDEFRKIINNVSNEITYKGIINYEDTVSVLKHYSVLVFPTKYKTEGIPGTILDAYSAGVPVIVSKWNSAEELVNDESGWIYEFGNNLDLEEKVLNLSIKKINDKKEKCLEKITEYKPENVVENFCGFLND